MAEKKEKYFEGVGRRKTAIARVRYYPKSTKDNAGKFIINGIDYKSYFSIPRFQRAAVSPLKNNPQGDAGIEVKVRGGGSMAQSEAITLGLARALVKFNPDLKKQLRASGYLTRDSRMVERKKPGLKKARRAPQWRKR